MADLCKWLVDADHPQGTLVPLTPAEITQHTADADTAVKQQAADNARAWHLLRQQRDRWLAETDWLVNSLPADAPAPLITVVAANLAAWKTYRQQLRDLPANTTSPDAPAWPKQPAQPAVRLT